MAVNADTLVGFVMAIVQLVIGLIVGIGTIYLGIKFVDKLTKNIEELEELKKGNLSVGIFIFAVIFLFAMVVAGGVRGLTEALTGATGKADPVAMDYVTAIGVGIVQLIVAILIAVVAIYIAMWIINKISVQIDKIKIKDMPDVAFNWEDSLKNNNLAMALFIAAILIGLAFVITEGSASIASTLAALFE
jgi:hypothetical protein